jgi:hypothetical protein
MEAHTHAETGVPRYKASQLSFNTRLPGTRSADAHGGQSCLGRSRRRGQDKKHAGVGETFCPKKEPGPSGWLIGIPGCCFVVGGAGRVKVGVENSNCQGTCTCRRLSESLSPRTWETCVTGRIPTPDMRCCARPYTCNTQGKSSERTLLPSADSTTFCTLPARMIKKSLADVAKGCQRKLAKGRQRKKQVPHQR